MPKLNLVRSILIPASLVDVYDKISDLNHWTSWSPWLILEKGVKVEVKKEGKFYSWEGDLTGAGVMEIMNEVANRSVFIDLTFLKPWKSKAKITLNLSEENGQTKVDWIMDSNLPFFLFFLKNMMAAALGMDFERGLRLLKDYVVDGVVHSYPERVGNADYPGCKYIGISGESSFESLASDMSTHFSNLSSLTLNDMKVLGAMSITHEWDMIKRKTRYTAALIVEDHPQKNPSGFVVGEIPATKIHSVLHKGPYDQLGNAWSLQSMLLRNKVIKHNKKIDPFEIYLNSSLDTSPNELLTDVCFPIR